MKKIIRFLQSTAGMVFLLLTLTDFVYAQSVVYSPPITITQGGTYTGNWEGNDPKVPAVKIATSEA